MNQGKFWQLLNPLQMTQNEEGAKRFSDHFLGVWGKKTGMLLLKDWTRCPCHCPSLHRCTWGGAESATLAQHLQPSLHDRLHLLPDHLQTYQEEVKIFFLPFSCIPHPLLGEVTVYWLATTTPEWRARQTASSIFLACVLCTLLFVHSF